MTKNYTKRFASDFTFLKYLFQLWALYCVSLPFLWIFYRIEFKGRENIPKKGKFICCANHISYFDPFITALVTVRPLAYMAKKELFENNIMGEILDFLAAFAVNREKLEVSTIKTVKEVFKTKHWCLGIFPQGGISRNKKIEKINKGFAVIAKASKTDVLPISIIGIEKYNWIPFKGKIIATVGKPISWNQEIDEIMDQWGKVVSEMAGYDYTVTTAKESDENFLQEQNLLKNKKSNTPELTMK